MNTANAVILDGSNTRVSFHVRWFGLVSVRGVFTQLRGGLQVGDGGLSSAQLTLEVEAASVRTGITLRDRHLRAERFLNADLHPVMRFVCRRATFDGPRAIVDGELSLRGISSSVRCQCTLGGVHGLDGTAALSGTATISRKHFGVGVPPGLAGLNPMFLAIADDVRVDVSMQVPASVLRSPAFAPAD